MIVLTGAGGFIGSVILGYLNRRGIDDVYIFDDLPLDEQYKNLIGKKYISLHSTKEMMSDPKDITAVIHCGANSNTLENNWSSLYQTNVLSTRRWWEFCKENDIPMIFTSSAAVYGNGAGPENHYAFSKLASEQELNGAVILRLFNVYGPNEYHKGRMASTIYHWTNQVSKINKIKVFENSDQYLRDFIYVGDVARVVYHFIENYQPGIYDVGTGIPVSFDTVADTILDFAGDAEKEYFPMPDDLKKQYQRFTRANTDALVAAGFDPKTMKSLDAGIEEYLTFLAMGLRF